jgi:hypothetical protein
MSILKVKNAIQPFSCEDFKRKLKQQLQGWPPKKKKNFAFVIMGAISILAFTQFAVGIRNTYQIFNNEEHFFVAKDSAAPTQDILKMLTAADSAQQAEMRRIDSLLEKGLIQTTISTK